jgi:hypothetical protein
MASKSPGQRFIGKIRREGPELFCGYMVAPHFDFFAKTPEWRELTADNANLVDWLARAEARRSRKATTWARVAEMAAGS